MIVTRQLDKPCVVGDCSALIAISRRSPTVPRRFHRRRGTPEWTDKSLIAFNINTSAADLYNKAKFPTHCLYRYVITAEEVH